MQFHHLILLFLVTSKVFENKPILNTHLFTLSFLSLNFTRFYLLLSLDQNQALRLCLGSTSVGGQYGAISALSINNDCSRLLCGFAKGQVNRNFILPIRQCKINFQKTIIFLDQYLEVHNVLPSDFLQSPPECAQPNFCLVQIFKYNGWGQSQVFNILIHISI